MIADGEPVGTLFVLLEGGLRVEKGGQLITTVTEPGVCVGEMSLLLGIPATADVVASEASVLAVDRQRAGAARTGCRVAAGAARLLGARLHVMTTYLVDIKQQYGDHEGGLGMVDVVLGSLMRSSGPRTTLGSETRSRARVLDRRERLLLDAGQRRPPRGACVGVDLDAGRYRADLAAGVHDRGRADGVDPAPCCP